MEPGLCLDREDLLYLWHPPLYGPLDAHREGYLRARATRARALELHPNDALCLVDVHKLDIAAVRLKGRPDTVKSLFDPVPHHHHISSIKMVVETIYYNLEYTDLSSHNK